MGIGKQDDLSIALDYEGARKLVKAQQNALKAAISEGNALSIQRITNWFLISPAPRQCFAVEVARSGKIKPEPTLADCLNVVENLNFFAASPEEAKVLAVKKPSGNYRPVIAFGLEHKVAQKILREVLSAHHTRKCFQFTSKGIHAAIEAARDHIGEGYVWYAHLDIKEFYSNFRVDELLQDAALGGKLPNKVLANYVHGHNLKMSESVRVIGGDELPSPKLTSLVHQARRGIPQGSSLSPLVAEMMVSQMVIDLPLGVRLTNYADNFLLLAKTKAELEQSVVELEAAIKELPGGHFKLKDEGSGCLEADPLEFLGHVLCAGSAGPRVVVSAPNHDRFYGELVQFDRCSGPYAAAANETSLEALRVRLAILYNYLISWKAAFRLCDNAGEIAATGFQHLKDHLAKAELTLDELKKLPVKHNTFHEHEHFSYPSKML